MKLGWIVLAEGIGADAKGALTAIGLNQNILNTSGLPALTKRAVIAHFIGEDAPGVGEISATFTVTSPSGNVIFANTVAMKVSGEAPPYPDLPISLDIPADMVLPVSEYGEHRIGISANFPDGSIAEGSVVLYVFPPQGSQQLLGVGE